MVFRCYVTLSCALVASYPLLPFEVRGYVFLLVTLAAIPAVGTALRRTPRGLRLPWWLVLSALILFNIGNMIWIWLVTWGGRATGHGSVADIFLVLAGVLVLAGALVVVVRCGRRDVGGVIDAGITSLAIGCLLWDAVLLPVVGDGRTGTGGQIALFVNVFMMTGTIGALVRVALVTLRRSTTVWLLTAAMASALTGNVLAAYVTDPATGMRPDWSNTAFLLPYAFLASAALHPSAARLVAPGVAPEDDLTPARMTFLGFMLAVVPLIAGVRAIAGLSTDGFVEALGSAGLIPLVMVRIARLAAQRRAALRALHRAATTDSLTGLPNRAVCQDRINTELAAGPDELAVLFCDLDGFKPVNDRLGHAAGDELLVAIAARLRAGLRDPDLVARVGGDEFVIVVRGPDKVEAICDRIRELVASPIQVVGEQVRVGLSVGVARALSADTTDSLLTRADLAMYDAKKTKTVGELSLAGV